MIHAKYTALAYLQTPFIAAVNLLWCSSFPFIICYTECFNDPFMLAEFVSGSWECPVKNVISTYILTSSLSLVLINSDETNGRLVQPIEVEKQRSVSSSPIIISCWPGRENKISQM